MFDWEKFRNREIVVLCPTIEHAGNFLSECEKRGFTFYKSKKDLLHMWPSYKDKTCYANGPEFIQYCSISYYAKEGFNIIIWGDDGVVDPEATTKELISEGKTLYERIINHYGEMAQMIVAIEEMSELTKALTKDMRGSINKDHVTEEMADVYICLEQLKIIHGITDDALNMWIRWKLERTEQKLKEDQGECSQY